MPACREIHGLIYGRYRILRPCSTRLIICISACTRRLVSGYGPRKGPHVLFLLCGFALRLRRARINAVRTSLQVIS
ncbi:hypothetical protein K469DRAFT_764221 [Zopfia rhizophila CBS 207.26]|uniref:Uncharacterized protein n=1 Tax=Zopfia rhizophila CBS 207.26 TaxID=1314779 RepID=A0A6A6EDC7_9PEZI|nr:hypothetical protein K469DRAFT_764221 [Zopfia rhizophila CBS 207.26]